jgi:hypothetical protein
VVPTVSRSETIIAVLCGIGAFAFIVYGILHMDSAQQKASGNTLSGKVLSHQFTPQKEEQISFGRGGLKGQHLNGDYVLKVYVKSENRSFEVPVDANTYEAVRDGANFSFLRPRSEQRK